MHSLLAVLLGATLLGVGPARAEATVPTVSPAVAVEVGVRKAGPDGACLGLPGAVGATCDAVGSLVGRGLESVVVGGARAVLRQLVGFVVEGAGWLVGQLVAFIEASTRPELTAGWFRGAYKDMTVVAGLGVLPFLLLALLQGILRQDVGLLLRAVFAYLPLAAVGTAGGVVVVDLLVELTDGLSAWVARSMGGDLAAFSTGLGTAVAALTVPSGPAVAGFAALLAAAAIAFGALVVWLELLLRQAAIYVAVLFLPLGFMALVWPATAHWLHRLVQGLVALILSKFVVVAVLALAAGALDARVEQEGFPVVISGAALLCLAALAPYVVLRLIPLFEAGLTAQLEGTYRRPTAAVAPPGRGGQTLSLVRTRAGGIPTGRAGADLPDGSRPPGGPRPTGPALGGSGGTSPGGPSRGGGTAGGSPRPRGAPGSAATGAGGAAAASGASTGVATGAAAAGAAARSAGRRARRGLEAATSSPDNTPPDPSPSPSASSRPSPSGTSPPPASAASASPRAPGRRSPTGNNPPATANRPTAPPPGPGTGSGGTAGRTAPRSPSPRTEPDGSPGRPSGDSPRPRTESDDTAARPTPPPPRPPTSPPDGGR